MITKLFAVVLLLLTKTVLSFHEIPHMLVLGIAKRDLQKNNPEILQIVEKYLGFFDSLGPQKQKLFEENSIWADDIKKYGGVAENWSKWHYDGKGIINPDQIEIPKFDSILNTENIISAYDTIKNTLTLSTFKGQITEVKIFLLKMLVHLIGDIHQPLHSGDRGGNAEIIEYNKIKKDLHFFFDSGCYFYNFKERLQRPVNDTFISYFNGELDRLTAAFPKESLQNLLDPKKELKDWAGESLKIAADMIYPYFKNTNLVNKEFYNQSFEMITKQIVLGGYRTSQALQQMFNQEKGLHKFNENNNNTSNQINPTKPDIKDKEKPVEPNNNNNNNNNNNIQENIQNKESDKSKDEDNKSIAIVLGVLFGFTFIAFLACVVVTNLKPTQKYNEHNRILSSEELGVKNFEDKQVVITTEMKL